MLTPGMYEGFRLPDGRVPRKVAGNAVQRENAWLNDETYLSYMWVCTTWPFPSSNGRTSRRA